MSNRVCLPYRKVGRTVFTTLTALRWFFASVEGRTAEPPPDIEIGGDEPLQPVKKLVRETLGRDLSPAQGWRWCRRGLVPISRGIPSEIDCDVIDAELEQHGIL